MRSLSPALWHARTGRPFSDINAELIGSSHDELFQDSRWLSRFGVPLIIRKAASREDDSLCWPSCQVLYEKGRKVDFVLAGANVSYKWPHTGWTASISAVMPFCWIKPVSLRVA